MKRIGLAVVALTVMVTGGVVWAKSPAGPPPARVQINDVGPSAEHWHFEPRDVTIKPGTTVIWQNTGQQTHTVTADDHSFDSGNVAPGQDWQWTFRGPGDFVYHCTPHPWMKATIHVH